jgi:Putative ABC exporter
VNVVTSLGERALYFSPSDVDFLFPGPFSRRQILVYKILGSVTAAGFIALMAPAGLARLIRSWPAAAVGCFLAWLMIGSLTMCAQLAAQTVGERAFTLARKFVLGGVLAAVAAALGQAASQGLDGPWQDTLLRVRHSLAAEIVLAPFVPVARVMAAGQLVPDALGWAALGAALIACIYALAVRLDANYLETAVRVSRQMQNLRRRAMTGGGVLTPRSRELRSSRLPRPPWMGGAGPLIRRQAIQAVRGSRGALIMTVIVVAAMGIPLAIGMHRHSEFTLMLPHMVIGVSAYLSILYSAQAPLGFRVDYERMDLLKSLPIRPLAMACGQTVVTALVLTLPQWSLFAATAVFVPAASRELLIGGLMILPFNWLLSGTENFLFLLYPAPLVATGSEGFFTMARVMLFMLVKFLVIGACGAVAAIPATIVYFATGSMNAALLAGWLTLLVPSSGVMVLVAWAFQRYDVGGGSPVE